LGAATQLAAYRYLKKHDLVENCRKMGDYLKQRVSEIAAQHPSFGDVRGRGLMVGIELVRDKVTKESFPASAKFALQVNREALKENMIIESSSGCDRGQSGDALVISPAFVITKDEVDKIVNRLDKVMTVVEERNGVGR
jgi:4-aminobutyrate aminotransferase-like enzyme